MDKKYIELAISFIESYLSTHKNSHNFDDMARLKSKLENDLNMIKNKENKKKPN
jgi:hypothetical protein